MDMTHGPTYSLLERYGLLHGKRFHLLMPVFVAWLTPSLARVCEVTGHVYLPMATYSGEGKCMLKVMARVLHPLHTTLVYMSLWSTWCATPAWSKVQAICDIPVGLLQDPQFLCLYICTFL